MLAGLTEQLAAAGQYARGREWERCSPGDHGASVCTVYQPVVPAFTPPPQHKQHYTPLSHYCTLDVEWLGDGTVKGTWNYDGMPVYSAIYDSSYDLIQKLEGTGNAPDTATSPGAVDTAAGHGEGA